MWKLRFRPKGANAAASAAAWLLPSVRRFPPPWSVEETDACFIEKPPRFGASNGRMEYAVAAIG